MKTDGAAEHRSAFDGVEAGRRHYIRKFRGGIKEPNGVDEVPAALERGHVTAECNRNDADARLEIKIVGAFNDFVGGPRHVAVIEMPARLEHAMNFGEHGHRTQVPGCPLQGDEVKMIVRVWKLV